MTFRDRYNLLSYAVRIADAPNRSSLQKLKALVKRLAGSLKLTSVTIYLHDQYQGCLSRKISSAEQGTVAPCHIPLGQGGAGICAEKRISLSLPPLVLHADEAKKGTEVTFLFEPISRNERFYGVIGIGLGPGQRLSATDRKLLLQVQAIALQLLTNLSADNDKKLKDLSLLYRVSNTILSTIELNKLIHLTLTALTSGPVPFFDRAMLFLINKRSGIMQGMLGVTRETSASCTDPFDDPENILASRWDISDESMACQRRSDFNQKVMASRLELNKSLNLASRAVLEKRLIYVPSAAREKQVDQDFIKQFGITSFAVAPLIAREKVVGVIVVDNTLAGRPITNDTLRFLQLFTNQAGMAIQNSILYNRIADTNRDLSEAQDRLIQGERLAAIGEMAAGIAHELKGPLVAIGGFARRLAGRLPKSSDEKVSADLIVREVLRLEKMLTDILSFSKKTTICYTPCNMTEIVKDALAVVRPSLEEKNIRVSTTFPRKSEALLGDCQQLKQVFINLFFNGQEAMKNGGELTIRIGNATLDGRKAVAVKIKDTGGGIPLETLHQIFNPFYTTKDTGTGLGLPIANRIITNHCGKIHINNRPGVGVEFSVVIPIQN
ncbi:ATP-binding protein [Geotalea sp. SG265]|uniref:GAF domain-containing sensor histidine kinase n=1 Tax=Geotalea sp. SG265 TaxID=2922867 RepID=UPI001FB0294C|nr:ATP-binding protein [Geotalea sp. SG265]